MEQQQVRARLRKCLALANDHRASKGERIAAQEATDALMTKHNLTAQDAWDQPSPENRPKKAPLRIAMTGRGSVAGDDSYGRQYPEVRRASGPGVP